MNSSPFLNEKCFLKKKKKYMSFEFYLEISLIILMWWKYFLFSE